MNVLVLNPVHPSTRHISAVRAFRFSSELQKLGHRVLLITGARPSDSQALDVVQGVSSQPTLLEVDSAAAEPFRPRALRRLMTVVHLVQDGGWNYSWTRSVPLAFQRRTDFRPDVIWVSFGKMEAVVAARRLARTLKVPWVLDVKDNWELYVPRGLRSMMVRRINGWSALTANSELFARMASEWQGACAEVVYSGADDAFLQAERVALPQGKLVVSIVGGLYFREPLEMLLKGLSMWQTQRGIPVDVRYVGADAEKMRSAACLVPDLRVHLLGYLSIGDLADVCAQSHVNMYISHPGTFHHKILELASAGRPVLACPSYDDESRRLLDQVGGQLLSASKPQEIVDSLDLIQTSERLKLKNPEAFSWTRQAMRLERVLVEVTNRWN